MGGKGSMLVGADSFLLSWAREGPAFTGVSDCIKGAGEGRTAIG